MATVIAYAQFTASKVGKNSITVNWNVEQITRSDGTRVALLTGASTNVTIGRNGLYGYRLTNADITLYDYVFTAITADSTVDQQEISALWTLYSISWHDIATSAMTTVGTIGKLFVDNINATITSRSVAGDAMTLTSGERNTLVDLVWDEPLTGATHNVANSSGRRLRQLASIIVWDGTAQGAGANGNQIILDSGASSFNGSYDPSLIAIVNGTGAGQCRLILDYVGSTRTATVDRTWRVNPDNTSEFIIYADAGREHVNEGLAQGGTTNTITLNSTASSTNDEYVGQLVFIRSGLGEDQVGLVTAYNGTTKVATVARNWATIPNTTSAYVMLPNHIHDLDEISTSVWSNATRTLTSFGTLVSDIWNNGTRSLTTFGTLVADIWSYVTRTLTSGGAGLTAQEVWEYSVRELTQAVTINVGDVWNYPRRTLTPPDNKYSSSDFVVDTNLMLTKGITNKSRFLLGDLTDVVDIIFTAKNRKPEDDDASIIQVKYTDGLIYLNGAAYLGNPLDAGFTILDVTTGLVEMDINVVASALLVPTVNRWFDVKTIFATNVYQPVKGFVSIEWDVTRAIS